MAAAGWNWALALSAFRAGWFTRSDGPIRLAAFNWTITYPWLYLQPLPSLRPRLIPPALWWQFASVLWHFRFRSFSVSAVLTLVPVGVKMVLELVLREFKEVQGTRGWEEAAKASHLWHLSFGFLSCGLWNFFLRLNATQGLSVFQVQDYSFVLFCVYWKTVETLACKWGGWPELGVSAGPGTKEVFTKYLSSWIIKLYSVCQRSFCK